MFAYENCKKITKHNSSKLFRLGGHITYSHGISFIGIFERGINFL